jgi:4-hydroxythreonine-4-phosphate dehydrogenase
MRSHIGITVGDPRGVGPEVLAKALSRLDDELRRSIKVYGDLDALAKRNAPSYGDDEAAAIAKASLEEAVRDALSGKVAAIVTSPVNKWRLAQVIPRFTGHTEHIAKLCGRTEATMSFAFGRASGGTFFISTVTTHMPLSKVPSSITADSIALTASRTHDAAAKFTGGRRPKLAVLSINPHAGEGGTLGDEEKTIIEPAIDKLHSAGIDCRGPFPSDAFFGRSQHEGFDAVIAMYHDQAMIPAKVLSGGLCTNVTLGLPFIRTSPGHGTAEDIAGKDIADWRPMAEAIKLAVKFSH